ncbi:MAG: type III polyketide synthase [Kiloniellaceae bacterium]
MLDLEAPLSRGAGQQASAPAPVVLSSIASAAPRHVMRQEDVVRRVRALFGDRSLDIERLLPAFGNAGIETRHCCVPIEWFLTPSNWKDRNALFIDNAVDLMAQAAQTCLAQAGLPFSAIDGLVTVSTTGIATPSLDARLMERLGFRRDVARLPIFGLGCAGGVLGLSRAASLAQGLGQARRGGRVLCLVAELCSLTFRANDRSKSNVIAAALFGDGAAAVLLEAPAAGGTSPATGLKLGAQGEYTWPDSLDVMGWEVENDGLGVLFSRDIPALIRERMGSAVDSFLARHGLDRGDIDGYVCHPGGAKVIGAMEEVFGLPEGRLREARSVLRDFGNMSAVTVLFVLERMRRSGMRGRYLMTALGPGFTAGFQILEAQRA